MKRFFSFSLFVVLLACGLFATTVRAQNPLKFIEALQQKQKQTGPAVPESAADDSVPAVTLPVPRAADSPPPVDDPFDIDEPLKNVEPAENVEELEAPLPSESKNSKPSRPSTPLRTEQQIPNPSTPSDISHPILGATLEKAAEGQLGVKVKGVLADSPAQAAGIQAGDRLISVAGSPIRSEKDLQELLKVLAPGDRIELEFVRGSRKSKTVATLAAGVAKAGGEIALSSATARQPKDIAPQSDPRSFDVVPVPADDRFDPRMRNQDSPPKLGIQVIDVVEESGIGLRKRVRRGAGVQSVAADSSAATAGLPIGALIVGANGRRIEKSADLVGYISTLKPGQEVELTYYDGNRLKRGKIELAGGRVQQAANFQPVPAVKPANDEAVRPILKGLGQQIPALRRVDNLLERIAPRTDGKVAPDGIATEQDSAGEGLGALREKLRIQQQERSRSLAERLERRPPLFPRGR